MKSAIKPSNVVEFPSSPAARNMSTSGRKLDFTTYEKHVRNMPLTPLEKERILDALWRIIFAFVDLGFGQHPTQHLRDLSELDQDINHIVDGLIPNQRKEA